MGKMDLTGTYVVDEPLQREGCKQGTGRGVYNGLAGGGRWQVAGCRPALKRIDHRPLGPPESLAVVLAAPGRYWYWSSTNGRGMLLCRLVLGRY